MATNPPIVIGEYADVPAPGSGVASTFQQKVARRTVHRFATVAARDAAYPAAAAGNGAMCVTLDTATVWTVNNTPAWVALQPAATVWTAAALINSWVNFTAGQPAQYRKLGDEVQLRGMIKGGAVGSVAFVLPVGFRPSLTDEVFAVISNAALGSIQVITGTGSVTVLAPSNTAYVYLSGIRFSTVA